MTADQLVIDTGLFLRKAEFTGEARLHSAHIAGELNYIEAKFTTSTVMRCPATALVVDSDMFLKRLHSHAVDVLPHARSSEALVPNLGNCRLDGTQRPRLG